MKHNDNGYVLPQAVMMIAATLALAACSGGPPPPAEATVNGVTSIDRDNGRAEFSVSAFDAKGTVLESGTIGNPSATVDQTGFTATPGVCGDGTISSQGPLTTILTLDASGSMSASDPDAKRADAAKSVVDRLRPDDRAAVSSFESYNGHVLYQELTSDKMALYGAIDEATYVGGGTPLWSASTASVAFLGKSEGTNKVAFIFTDGEDTEYGTSAQEVVAAAQANHVRVFMVGLGTPGSLETSDMVTVATQTGGLYNEVSDDTGLDALFNNAFSAAVASGCIDLTFSPVPPAGQTVSGELSFDINGGRFNGDYQVTF